MTDIVKEAENVIQKLCTKKIIENDKVKFVPELKTNQIRKFLAAVNKLSNKISIYKAQNPKKDILPDDICVQIRFLKVKAAYQMGRERTVNEFMNKAGIPAKIDAIGNSIHAYEEFANYMEALVAYHKYYGGQD